MKKYNSGNTNTILIVIVIIIVVALAVWYFAMHRTAAPANNGGADINVTLPGSDTSGGGSTTGGGTTYP